jgi:uncharacterized Zn-binding protein involved in type VI secretion
MLEETDIPECPLCETTDRVISLNTITVEIDGEQVHRPGDSWRCNGCQANFTPPRIA